MSFPLESPPSVREGLEYLFERPPIQFLAGGLLKLIFPCQPDEADFVLGISRFTKYQNREPVMKTGLST